MHIKILILLMGSLSTAYALKCYLCTPADSTPCTKTLDCGTSLGLDRCFTSKVDGHVVKGCINNASCNSPISCCKGDLCNGAIAMGPSAIFLMLASAIFTLFF